jgi:hypothetical protein
MKNPLFLRNGVYPFINLKICGQPGGKRGASQDFLCFVTAIINGEVNHTTSEKYSRQKPYPIFNRDYVCAILLQKYAYDRKNYARYEIMSSEIAMQKKIFNTILNLKIVVSAKSS